MTQCNETMDKSIEMEKIFKMLSEENQEIALNILQALQNMQSQVKNDI